MTKTDSAPNHPDYDQLIAYWSSKVPEGARAPRLADIELMDLYRLATRMVVIDVERPKSGPLRFRWRLAGTRLRDFIGIEMTGKYLHDVADEETTRQTTEALTGMVETGEAHFWTRTLGLKTGDKKYRSYSRLLLPLLGAGGAIDHLIGVYVLEAVDAAQAPYAPKSWHFVMDPD